MNEHLLRVKDQETIVHYLGKDIQNELIQIRAGAIKQQILAHANSANYYSFILHCTPDVSHFEQTTMIAWFVDVLSPSDNEMSEPKVIIREQFLVFVPQSLQVTASAYIAETLLEQLEQMGLPIEDMHGQGYDNGSYMKGKENGEQKRIVAINPHAFFAPCNAHSLNSAVNNAAGCCLEATGFFSLIQHIYNYFSAATKH